MNSGCGKRIAGGKNMCQQFFCLMTMADLSLTEGKTCLRSDNGREAIKWCLIRLCLLTNGCLSNAGWLFVNRKQVV